MKRNQKGNVLLIVIIVALVVFLFWWLMQKGYKVPGLSQTAEGPAIQNTSDLDSASKDLDSQDMTQFDTGLSQLSSDTSSF